MSNYLNADGIIYEFRTGKVGDEFQTYTSVPKKVVNNYIVLEEFPVRLNRVQVYDGATPYSEIDTNEPTALQYFVEYSTKRIFFNNAAEGKTLLISYSGRGMAFISSDMVYSNSSGGLVTEVLSTLIVEGQTALDKVVTIVPVVTNAVLATTNANNAATNANNIITALAHKGIYSSGTAYLPNNIVTYNGTAYMCILAGTGQTPSSSSTYWKKMNNFVNQGTYSTSTTYYYGDCVVDSLNQNVYMSIIDSNLNQALTLTAKWQLLVSVASAITTINATNTTVTTAEGLRVTAESGRVTAETGRVSSESTRSTNETARGVAESTRSSNDTSRTTAETARASAETTRGTNESTRQTNETNRGTVESTRVTNESSRVTAESGRSTAESTRVSNETTRVSQETTRQTKINALIHLGTYSSATAYVANNIVTYNGTAFMCILAGTNQTPSSSSTYWKRLSNFNNLGTYSTVTTYNYGDTVVDNINQNVYMSIIDSNLNQALTLSAKWQLLVSVASAITTVNTTNTSVTTAEGLRVTAEIGRVTTETSRATVESGRVSAESTRGTNETNRGTAEASRASAETTRVSNETSRGTAETNRVGAESSRVTVESGRVTAESGRTGAESTRVSSETTRGTNETARVAAESSRASAETTRSGNETTRQSNETARIGRDNAFKLIEAYNASTAYVPLNKVTFGGQTYQCILASTGNSPTNTTYFILIAAKGTDGTGAGTVLSVTSANSDIVVASTTTNPLITLNSANSGANKILKLDGSGYTSADILIDGTTNKAFTATEKTKLANTQKLIAEQTSAPSSPVTDDLWIDTTSSPNIMKRWSGSAWIIVGSTTGGTVTSVTSANTDASIATTTSTPVITINTGTGANQIVKRDGSANIVEIGSLPSLLTTDKTSVVNAINELKSLMNTIGTYA